MTLVWVAPDQPLPSPGQATPEGLVAAGLDLSVPRLLEAYSQGMFPWYSPGDPVLWWCPDPRMVLKVDQFRASHSLAKKLRQIQRRQHDTDPPIRVTCDLVFDQVIAHCAALRAHAGTWISPDIQRVYGDLHRAGHAHSIETWMDGQLAGGLYGVNLGRFFFGESMFALRTDASKIALAHLVDFLQEAGIQHIDCQQETQHLASLGARPIARADFLLALEQALPAAAPRWPSGTLRLRE
ncbi:MAG TPA: leucyl/phenylalanyl-tRNA--protein transferase [Alcaligenes sp.]|nr:leucyl/phenylalanyl-tRNA--protein transferase [Alcaligenes sp.]HRL26383.1 leucyl/phenylalanyl-tRNA--protein transferase [Alcaligenes sp.]